MKKVADASLKEWVAAQRRAGRDEITIRSDLADLGYSEQEIGEALQKPLRWLFLALVLLVAVLLGVAAFLFLGQEPPAPPEVPVVEPPQAAGRTIAYDVYSVRTHVAPFVLYAWVNDTVVLRLHTEDDGNGSGYAFLLPAFNVSAHVPPNGSVEVSFVADVAGEARYLSVSGSHKNWGKLVVK